MSTNHHLSEEAKYDKMFSFFKWCISVAFIFITILTSIAIFATYKDRSDMKADYRASIDSLRNQATREILSLQYSSNTIALQETKSQIDSIFKTPKIKQLVQEVATKDVKDKVIEIIDKEIKINSEIDDASASMAAGRISGMEKLRSFFRDFADSRYAQKAKIRYNALCEEYYQRNYKYANPLFFHIVNNTVPENERARLAQAINDLNGRDQSLDNIALIIIGLSANLDHKFKPFQIDEINKWYASLKK